MVQYPAGAPIQVVPLTQGPSHHFFGYYDKHQWDAADRRLLTLQVDFADRQPGPHDVARVCVIDTHRGNRLEVIGETRAWCWQQGCMLQWLPGTGDCVIYNDRIADRFVSVILQVPAQPQRPPEAHAHGPAGASGPAPASGLASSPGRAPAAGQVQALEEARAPVRVERVLPRPIYTVSPDGRKALSLNFSRLARTRPGYGYAGLPDFREHDPHPDDDGVFIMDLETGEHELLVSIGDLARLDPEPSMEGAVHWVNHLLFSPSSQRFVFLHRWSAGKGFQTRMYTCGIDGRGLHRVPVDRASHFIWYDDDHILVWARTEHGDAYHLCRDMTGETRAIGKPVLSRDGHCTRSPDGAWILTDEYPGPDGKRPLILYHVESGRRIDLVRLASPPVAAVELRCDLHPRWNRAGTHVCIDSTHEGSRQMYLVDVRSIVGS